MFKEPDLEIVERIVEAESVETEQKCSRPAGHVVPTEVLNLRPKIVQDEETESVDQSGNVYSSKLAFKHMVLALGFTLFWAVVFQRLFSFTNPEYTRADSVNDYVHQVFLPAVRYTLFGALPCLLIFVSCSIYPREKLLKRLATIFSLLVAGISSSVAIIFGQIHIANFLGFAAPCTIFAYLSILIWKEIRHQVGIYDEELKFERSKLSIGQRYILVCLFPFAAGSIMVLATILHSFWPVIIFAIAGCRFIQNRRFRSLIFLSALLAGLLALPLILVGTPSLDASKWNEILRVGLQSKIYAAAALCIVVLEVLRSIKRSIESIRECAR